MVYYKKRYGSSSHGWHSGGSGSSSSSGGSSGSMVKLWLLLGIVIPFIILILVLYFVIKKRKTQAAIKNRQNLASPYVPPLSPVLNPSPEVTSVNSILDPLVPPVNARTNHNETAPPYSKSNECAPPYSNIDSHLIISSTLNSEYETITSQGINDLPRPANSHYSSMV